MILCHMPTFILLKSVFILLVFLIFTCLTTSIANTVVQVTRILCRETSSFICFQSFNPFLSVLTLSVLTLCSMQNCKYTCSQSKHMSNPTAPISPVFLGSNQNFSNVWKGLSLSSHLFYDFNHFCGSLWLIFHFLFIPSILSSDFLNFSEIFCLGTLAITHETVWDVIPRYCLGYNP